MTAAQWAFCGLLLTLAHIVSGHGICKSAYCSRGEVGKFTGDIREGKQHRHGVNMVALDVSMHRACSNSSCHAMAWCQNMHVLHVEHHPAPLSHVMTC